MLHNYSYYVQYTTAHPAWTSTDEHRAFSHSIRPLALLRNTHTHTSQSRTGQEPPWRRSSSSLDREVSQAPAGGRNQRTVHRGREGAGADAERTRSARGSRGPRRGRTLAVRVSAFRPCAACRTRASPGVVPPTRSHPASFVSRSRYLLSVLNIMHMHTNIVMPWGDGACEGPRALCAEGCRQRHAAIAPHRHPVAVV